MNMSFKKFNEVSKWLIKYNELTALGKIKFYLQLPIRYLLFKKVYKKEMEEKKNV